MSSDGRSTRVRRPIRLPAGFGPDCRIGKLSVNGKDKLSGVSELVSDAGARPGNQYGDDPRKRYVEKIKAKIAEG
jgi:hypothetical protein